MSAPLSLFQTTANRIIPPFPLWLYKCLAIFPVTGLIGLDHFAVGSSMTGVLKLFVNMITLGSWYAYDIVQVLYPANLRENGLQVPFLETGHIGKGRIDETPMSIMTKNTKLWIMIIFVALFGGLFLCVAPFITSGTDAGSTSLRWIGLLSFFLTIIMFIATVVYYLGNKIMSIFKGKATPSSALSSVVSMPGTSILKKSSSFVSGPSSKMTDILGTGAAAKIGSIPGVTLFGGGELNDLTNIANEVMEGGRIFETYDHILFPLIILLLPLSGFIIHTLRKRNKK